MELQIQPGTQQNADGVLNTLRAGRTGEALVSEFQGRFYENCYRGNLYSTGASLTALAAATISLSATCQPIVGVWNPPTSPVNLVILQISLFAAPNSTSPVAPGAFVLAASIGVPSLTAGLAPFNRKTLQSNGSQAKAFNVGTASLLTGLVAAQNLVVFEGLGELGTPQTLNATTIAAATVTPSANGVANIDGSIIVPPGGVLALLNTVSTATISVAARMLWAEVAV